MTWWSLCLIIILEQEEANGTLAYLAQHGARVIGMLKSQRGGFNNVYRLVTSLSRSLKWTVVWWITTVIGLCSDRMHAFLAEQQEPDHAEQLVLSLYATLAHGMTRGTGSTK